MNFDKFTDNQKSAILADGGVLVTASAGSGKTTVLVQRVMNKIINKGVPIDRLLIVTFTNAAAAEMRERIEKSLAKAQASNPKDKLIAAQKQRLSMAKICTVDSFCIDLVRENFDRLGIMPDFSVVDPASLESLYDQALSDVLEPMYEENSSDFKRLLQSTGDSYGDDRLKDYIKSIYEYVTNMPFYADWLKNYKEYYKSCSDFFGSIWDKLLLEEACREFDRVKNIACDVLSLPEINQKENEFYRNAVNSIFVNTKTLCDCQDGKALLKTISGLAPVIADRKRSDIAKATANAVKEYNNIISDITEWYGNNENDTNKRFEASKRPVIMLIELTEAFDKRIFELMCEQNMLTFAAVEQQALKLLCENTQNGLMPTDRGIELAENYDEIIVDEYQDTNDLQDALVQILSDGGKRLFVVGDAKQSIYEFRGTNPSNFISKIKSPKFKMIPLLDNFRSRKNVCRFINTVFEDLMTEKNSKIDYKGQRLAPFDKSDDTAAFVNLYSTEGLKADEAARVEAAYIADYIKTVMAQKEGELTYTDFTILMRGNNRMDIYVDTLKEYGVPAVCNRSDFYNKREINLVLSLLTAVDNPTKDAELLAVMMSALFGFNADKLALLRHDFPASSIWASVLAAANAGQEEYINLCEKMQEYRRLNLINKLPDFISVLFDVTGIEDVVRAMDNGQQRVKNLRVLQSMAADYDKNNDRGLSGFLNMMASGQGGQPVVDESSNAVKVTTMHSSKGLEYPVCIIAGAGNAFGGRRSTSYSIKNSLGIALDVYGDTLADKTLSPVKIAIDIKNSKDNIAEEMRLMYVFMTRAKQKLAIFAGYSNLEKRLKELKTTVANNSQKPNAQRAKCYADWILQSFIAASADNADKLESIINGGNRDIDGARFSMLYDIAQPQTPEADLCKQPDQKQIKNIRLQLEENFKYEYPFESQTQIPSKISVSEFTHKDTNREYNFTRKPAFLSKNQLTPAQRGVATHLYMQFCDLQKGAASAESELERLTEYRFITEQQANAVDMKAINTFFASDLYKRICNANKCHREIRFLTQIYPDGEPCGDATVLQGVADCVLVENDGLVIVDFKTDHINNEQQFIDVYKQQLKLYADACQKTFGLPVKECIIYSFVLGKAIKV